MPDLTQSDRLRELRSSFPPNTREVQTIELRQSPAAVSELLDVVFVVDTTGSMTSIIDRLTATLADVATGLGAHYTSTRYAVVEFKDEVDGETFVSTGADFVNLATAQATLGAIVASGGNDIPENGYGAIVLGCKLPWRSDATRAMLLVTDAESHSRGKSLAQARSYLLRESVFFFTYTDEFEATSYTPLEEVTYGAHLVGTTDEELTEQIIEALTGLGQPVEPPIYLVSDNMNFAAKLEDGTDVVFLQRSFVLDPFTSGEEGTIGIPLTIDNTDLAVSRYTRRAKAYGLPIEVIIRVYDDDDRLGPQNDPPLRLYASEFESRGATVSCQLSWIDLHNAVFPNEFYTPTKCPSLQ